MSANQINAFIRNESKVTRVAFFDINLAVCTFVLKVNFLAAAFKRNVVDIYADNIAVKQLRLNKSSTAVFISFSCKHHFLKIR